MPFGKSTGWVLAGTNFAVSLHFVRQQPDIESLFVLLVACWAIEPRQHGNMSQTLLTWDNLIARRHSFSGSKGMVVAYNFGKCGCPGEYQTIEPGVSKNNAKMVAVSRKLRMKIVLAPHPPPGVLAPPPDARPGCLFNVKTVPTPCRFVTVLFTVFIGLCSNCGGSTGIVNYEVFPLTTTQNLFQGLVANYTQELRRVLHLHQHIHFVKMRQHQNYPVQLQTEPTVAN